MEENMKQIIFPEEVFFGWYDSRKSNYRDLLVSPYRRTVRFELELPVGDSGVPYINGVRPVGKKGFIVCAKPGDLRYTRLPYQCYYIHLVLSEGELYHRLMELPSFIPIEPGSPVTEFFIGEDFVQSLGNDLCSAAKLLTWIDLLTRQSKKYSDGMKSMEQIHSYIQNNLEKDLSLNVLAAYAGLSPSYFHSAFKKCVGKTVREYVEDQRLKKAIGLLITTEKTLVEIAYDCGFSSQSYFKYDFKRKMNLSPREYVKEYCNRYEN